MMRRTRMILMVAAALPICLLLHGHDERDKNHADGDTSSAQLFIAAWA